MHREQIVRLFGGTPIMPSTKSTEPKTVRAIVEMVAHGEQVSAEDILSAKRHGDIMMPRHIAMTLARKHLLLSWSQIGRRMNRDHSTIMHGAFRIERLRYTDRALDNKLRQYDQAIQERWP